MGKSKKTGFAFIALAAAFFAIGISTNKTFVAVAAAFLAMGIVMIVKSGRKSD